MAGLPRLEDEGLQIGELGDPPIDIALSHLQDAGAGLASWPWSHGPRIEQQYPIVHLDVRIVGVPKDDGIHILPLELRQQEILQGARVRRPPE